MKLLVVLNFYPPHAIGGYELGCRDVVDVLRARGHDVHVLTGTHGVYRRSDEGHVHRWLSTCLRHPAGQGSRLRQMAADEWNNQRALRRAVRRFRPDIVYIWNLGCTTVSLAAEAERCGRPVCYYVSDEWPERWTADLSYRFTKPPMSAARRAVQAALWCAGVRLPLEPPALANAQFTSDFIRRRVEAAGYRPGRSWVIPWGVPVARFPGRVPRWPACRVLYVGQLSAHKGVHTGLAAFARVSRADPGRHWTLTLAGTATFDPAYQSGLRDLAVAHGVVDRVTFLGQVPREETPRVYADHDVLLFPSEWDEPFSIALVEAMASGIAVLTTMTGGTPEIVRPEENAITFRAGDVADCAAGLARLAAGEALYQVLCRNARATAEARFDLARMVDEIEDSLRETLRSGGGAGIAARQPADRT